MLRYLTMESAFGTTNPIINSIYRAKKRHNPAVGETVVVKIPLFFINMIDTINQKTKISTPSKVA